MARGEAVLKPPGNEAAERLAIEAAQRDPSRFARLYEDHFDRIYAFIARRVHDRDEVQDLTSEVFHRALKNLAQFEWRGISFAAWLYRIATNAIIDRSKDRSKRANPENVIDAGDRFVDDSVADVVEAVQERARLFGMVEKLPADQRRVIVMRFSEDKTIGQTAKKMRRSEGAIKQLQFRGLQNLRNRIGKANG
jgi:RNA polymerase sigma-70 factor (ECF subfamily)